MKHLLLTTCVIFGAVSCAQPETVVSSDPEAVVQGTGEIVEALGRLGAAWSPSLSPAGDRLAYVTRDGGSPQIWVRNLTDNTSVQLTDLDDPVGAVEWSPVGDQLAYTILPGGGLNSQVWIMNSDGTNARQMTAGGNTNNGFSGWTDDGQFLKIDTNMEFASARDAALLNVETGEWTMLTQNQGLNGITDLKGTKATVLRLVGRGDINLHLIDVDTGEDTLLTPHEGKAESLWGEMSPDGKTIYVNSNIDRDRSAFGTITLNEDGTFSPISYFATRDDAVADGAVLSDDGSVAALSWNANGRFELVLYDTQTGEMRTVEDLPVDTGGVVNFSGDGSTLLLTGGAANRTFDIYALDVESLALTRITESRHDGVDLGALVRPELIEYEAPDGVPLSGWLYRPAGQEGPMPLVFNYHGGPEGQSRPTMNPTAQALVSTGIAVFAPNVRGSSGFGKTFMAMDDRANRFDSFQDIQASTDALIEMGVADPDRLGIMGGSYGGYMVMVGVTEFPSMFAAGVNLFGVVNFESFFRETEPWMAAISTTEYGDPVTEADMLRDLSPIHKLDQITTPLFVLHGANDTNVPVVEAEQIVEILGDRGVPVKYTLFPDEGHGWRKTENRVRSTTEIVDFFNENL